MTPGKAFWEEGRTTAKSSSRNEFEVLEELKEGQSGWSTEGRYEMRLADKAEARSLSALQPTAKGIGFYFRSYWGLLREERHGLFCVQKQITLAAVWRRYLEGGTRRPIRKLVQQPRQEMKVAQIRGSSHSGEQGRDSGRVLEILATGLLVEDRNCVCELWGREK